MHAGGATDPRRRDARTSIVPDELELAAATLEPYWRAVQDAYAEYEVEPGYRLDRLRRTRIVVADGVHDSDRHYARCYDSGMLIEIAPECVDLPLETFLPIVAHEFGHAADYAYPGCWIAPENGRGAAVWIPRRDQNSKQARRWRSIWHGRNESEDPWASAQIEWTADAIARTVTGRDITYCGPCMLQCFSPHGVRRPKELR